MKAIETKSSSSNHLHSPRQAGKPFFSKGGEAEFFSKRQPEPEYFFSKPAIQTKLTIGQPSDRYEQEADAAAEKVVRGLTARSPQTASSTPTLQTKCAGCEQEEKLQQKQDEEELPQASLQRKAIFESDKEPGTVQRMCEECAAEEEDKVMKKSSVEDAGSASPSLESHLNGSKGGGSPLPAATRSEMEGAFGTDFSGVRVHSDSSAVQMNRELGAQAFTHGSDVYFGAGKYDAGSSNGKGLLAHELTHVVQQEGSHLKVAAKADNIVQCFDSPEHIKLGDDATKGTHGEVKTIALTEDYRISFGEMIAMAGDYFESVEQMKRLAQKTGTGAGTREELEYARVVKIRKNKEREKDGSFSDSAKEAVNKRYYQLAGKNRSHFLNPTTNDEKLAINDKAKQFTENWNLFKPGILGTPIPDSSAAGYRANHIKALENAHVAGMMAASIDYAMAYEAFAAHYLTDSFSGGHTRTQRASISEHWNPRVPMFNYNLKGYIAEKLAESSELSHVFGNIHYREDVLFGGVPFVDGTLATVTQKLDAKGSFEFGDVVAGALHDYDSKYGVEVKIGNSQQRVRLFGDMHLGEGAEAKMAVNAVQLGVKEVERAWEAGKKGISLDISVSQMMTNSLFAAETLLPIPVAEEDLSESDQQIKWDYDTVEELFNSKKFQEALKVFCDEKAVEFEEMAEEMDDENQKRAFRSEIIRRLTTEPVKTLNEVIDWTPDTGGGAFGHNEDDNALDYANELNRKEDAFSKLSMRQRTDLVKKLASGVWAAGDEEEMIVKIFEGTPVFERMELYQAVEGHAWNGDFVEGLRVDDDDLWNAIDDDDRLKRLRDAINEGYRPKGDFPLPSGEYKYA